MTYQISICLPRVSAEEQDAFNRVISSLAELSRELNRRSRVIIHGSSKPPAEWQPGDGVSLAHETEKIRGKMGGGNTLHLQIKSAGGLKEEDILQQMQDACEGIPLNVIED